MTQAFQGVSAEYIFFCAYLASDDEAELSRVNEKLLSNFLEALELNGATRKIKRFVLTCGFKQYGVHIGPGKQLLLENDLLLENKVGGVDWPLIFYYPQQRFLANAAKKGSWEWVATLPEDVLGYARGNFMNEATALGLYCAVSKALPGSELPFIGSRANYFAFNCWTSANLHAKFCLWAAVAPAAGNQIFNVMNGDTESFQTSGPVWPPDSGVVFQIPCFPTVGFQIQRGSRRTSPPQFNYRTSHLSWRRPPDWVSLQIQLLRAPPPCSYRLIRRSGQNARMSTKHGRHFGKSTIWINMRGTRQLGTS